MLENIENLLIELKKSKDAYELLKKVYIDLITNNSNEIFEDTSKKIHEFFEFDDVL